MCFPVYFYEGYKYGNIDGCTVLWWFDYGVIYMELKMTIMRYQHYKSNWDLLNVLVLGWKIASIDEIMLVFNLITTNKIKIGINERTGVGSSIGSFEGSIDVSLDEWSL